MKKKPLISIIVPIYNAEKYIDRCMKSIYSQTFTDYEIILVNDGSTDKSDEICRKYQEQDSRVTYIKKENEGAGSARNRGMDAAKGEYLAFPDVDDWFEPEMYEELYALAKSGDFDVIFSGANYYQQTGNDLVYSRTENVKSLSFTTREECREHIMDFFPTTTVFDVPWNKLYKRSIVVENQIHFPDIRRCQDATFNIDFYNCVNSAASVNMAYYNYMENTVVDVQRKFPKNLIDIYIFYFSHLIGILKEWGVYDGLIKRQYDTSFIISVYSTASRFDNPRWKLNKSEQKEYILDVFCRPEVVDFLPDADIRDDVKYMFDSIKAKDVTAVIKNRKQEKWKETVRKNKLIIGIYRKLRGK